MLHFSNLSLKRTEKHFRPKVLHRDIHIGNLYVKTENSNDAGGELGDWGFAECQDLHIVQQRLQPLNCAFPKMAEPIIPASSPLSTVSSLTSMSTSPKPFQQGKTLRPRQLRVLAQAPSWQTLTTDNESDFDAQRASTSDPWEKFRSWAGAANPNVDLAERTVSRVPPKFRTILRIESFQGNTACVSVRLMYAAAVERFCPHEVRDDLESFFYVIVIIMVTFHEAGKQKSTEELEDTMLADHWWNQQHWRSSTEWKVTTMKQDALWKSCVAPHTGPYFDCFKPVVDKMRKAVFHQYNMMQDLDAVRNIMFLTFSCRLTLDAFLRYWTTVSHMRR